MKNLKEKIVDSINNTVDELQTLGSEDIANGIIPIIEDHFKYKKYNKYTDNFVDHGYLHDLMISKKFISKRKPIGENFGVSMLIYKYLMDYGLKIFGSTYLKDKNGTDSYPMVSWIMIDSENIPLENLEIIHKLYMYKDSFVDIGLSRGEEYDYSILLNTNDYSCVLRRHVHGKVTNIKKFNTIEESVIYYRSI